MALDVHQQFGDAIPRAGRRTEEGRAALLEVITSPEQRFFFRKPPVPKD